MTEPSPALPVPPRGTPPAPGTTFLPGEWDEAPVSHEVTSAPPAPAGSMPSPPTVTFGDASRLAPTGPFRAYEPPAGKRNRGLRGALGIAALGAIAIAVTYQYVSTNVATNRYADAPLVEIDAVPPIGTFLGGTLDNTESLTANLSVRRGADESYVESAQQLARMFGMELMWAKDAGQSDCAALPDNSNTHVAVFCELEPYYIRLNSTHVSMPELLYDVRFVDIIKHEIAHHIIAERCGTATPDAAGSRFEGVTNSYAVLYLNADRGALTPAGANETEYSMSDATDAAARRIRGGDCG